MATRTIRSSNKDGGVPGVVDGDVGLEAGPATRLFDDVRGESTGQDVNPTETNTCWFAGVVESFLADEMRRKNVDGLSGRVL